MNFLSWKFLEQTVSVLFAPRLFKQSSDIAEAKPRLILIF